MAVNVKTNANTIRHINLRYNTLVGRIYLNTEDANKAVKAVEAEIGDAEVKKGFQGMEGDTTSAKAFAMMKERGVVFPDSIDGKLMTPFIKEVDSNGSKIEYLQVTLQDGDEKYHLSLNLENEGAQTLIRKLVNATPVAPTWLSIFGAMKQKEGETEKRASVGVSLKQGENEKTAPQVAIVPFSQEVQPLIEEALQKLRDADVDDPKTIAQRRSAVRTKYHRDLMAKVNAAFTAFFDSQRKASEQSETATA